MPFIGYLVSGIVSWLLNSNEKKQRMREQERHQIKGHLVRLLMDGQREHTMNLTRGIRNIEHVMQEDLMVRIKREQQSREQALKSLQDARKRNASETQARLEPLKTILAQLDQLCQDIEALASNVTEPESEQGHSDTRGRADE